MHDQLSRESICLTSIGSAVRTRHRVPCTILVLCRSRKKWPERRLDDRNHKRSARSKDLKWRDTYGECGGIGRHTGLWFRRRGIASSSLVTYPKVVYLVVGQLKLCRVSAHHLFMEEWPSGLWHCLGKAARVTPPQVRILFLPPWAKIASLSGVRQDTAPCSWD